MPDARHGPAKAPEFSRPVPVGRLPAGAHAVTVEATPAEAASVATRLGVEAIPSLRCEWRLRKRVGTDDEWDADGTLEARLVRICVVTLEPFEASVRERFAVRFVPDDDESALGDDDDLDAPDTLPYAGAAIDLGEAAVEQLALSLDPYPRAPVADTSEDADEDEVSVFRDPAFGPSADRTASAPPSADPSPSDAGTRRPFAVLAARGRGG